MSDSASVQSSKLVRGTGPSAIDVEARDEGYRTSSEDGIFDGAIGRLGPGGREARASPIHLGAASRRSQARRPRARLYSNREKRPTSPSAYA